MRIGLISDTHGLLRPEAIRALDRVIVTGHSHKPAVVERSGTLFVNPGSAGPQRFKLPITMGYLTIAEGAASAEIRNLA